MAANHGPAVPNRSTTTWQLSTPRMIPVDYSGGSGIWVPRARRVLTADYPQRTLLEQPPQRPALPSISLVQYGLGDMDGGSPGAGTPAAHIDLTWLRPTTPGSLLIAVIAYNTAAGGPPGGGDAPVTPAGWTFLAVELYGQGVGGGAFTGLWVYYSTAAPSQSTQTFSVPWNGNPICIIGLEISGASGPDQVASAAANSGTTPDTGATASTVTVPELAVAWYMTGQNVSAPTNGFVFPFAPTTNFNNGATLTIAAKSLSALGPQDCAVTQLSGLWAAMMTTWQ